MSQKKILVPRSFIIMRLSIQVYLQTLIAYGNCKNASEPKEVLDIKFARAQLSTCRYEINLR